MTIKTNRLLLVPVQIDHIADIYKHFNKQIITYLIPSVPAHISTTETLVQNFIEQKKNKTDYVYAITLIETGEFIGLTGLHDLKNPIPTLGIWTKYESHGNHYGRETIGGMIQLAGSLGFKKSYYPVDRRNIASTKIPLFYGGQLIKKCEEKNTFDDRILELVVYEITV